MLEHGTFKNRQRLYLSEQVCSRFTFCLIVFTLTKLITVLMKMIFLLGIHCMGVLLSNVLHMDSSSILTVVHCSGCFLK